MECSKDKIIEVQSKRAVRRAWKKPLKNMKSKRSTLVGVGRNTFEGGIGDDESQGYRLSCIRDIVEPATVDLEERDCSPLRP